MLYKYRLRGGNIKSERANRVSSVLRSSSRISKFRSSITFQMPLNQLTTLSMRYLVSSLFWVSTLRIEQWLTGAAGFSFSGEVREPFPAVIEALENTKLPITSVDAPSSWNIETGPPKSGLGARFMPTTLVSLTAPKPLVQHFRGRHFIGGRYVPKLLQIVITWVF